MRMNAVTARGIGLVRTNLSLCEDERTEGFQSARLDERTDKRLMKVDSCVAVCLCVCVFFFIQYTVLFTGTAHENND